MAANPVGFSWVNYTSTSIVKKDEEDISIIKSHAMRVVHRGRRKTRPNEHKTKVSCPKAGSAEVIVQQYDPFLYQPETDWEGLAVCQFMEDFVYPHLSTNSAFQYLNFLPKLWNKYS